MELPKRHYNITLTKKQKYAIYNITDNKDKQNRLMSIYQYCIKYTDKTTGILTKTIGKLFSMYSIKDFKYHTKISRKYFYTLIDILIDNKLIFANKVHKTVHKTVHKCNVSESVEDTSIKPISKKPNNPTTNHNTNIYTSNTSSDVIEAAEEILKELDIKSKHIKNMVLESISKAKIDTKGMVSYIYAVILDKVKVYYKNRDIYKQKVIKTKSIYNTEIPKKQSVGYKFNNFEPRSMYSDNQIMKELEEGLTNCRECKSDIEKLLSNYRY